MNERFPSSLRKAALAALLLLGCAPAGYAHSGKARFHAVIDTDGAADDLRAISMLLGNREIEVLALTTSDGALAPDESAVRVRALLDGFHHEGVPVGAGYGAGAEAPAWRGSSRRVDWGDTLAVRPSYPAVKDLLAETLRNEEEKVVILALGALTNVRDLLEDDPTLAERIDRIVWYNDQVAPLAGPNYAADPAAARAVLASGVPVTVIAANPAHPFPITPALLDSIAAVGTPYARKIADTHRRTPLSQQVADRHLGAWDDLVAVYLFAPELFRAQPVSETVTLYSLPDAEAVSAAEDTILAILRGKPDTESRVFYGFPTGHALYAADVVPLIDETIARHGASEWRAGVLTNELHGHLGIYATVGVKMGIRAREYFNIGVDDIEVTTYAGHRPPISCMNDGLQVGTGASVGHGLITVADVDRPRPEARFSFKGKTIRLTLKPEYADRIRRDVQRGIEQYGDLTEPYWQYVRELALQYWRDFDRHEIFDLYVEE